MKNSWFQSIAWSLIAGSILLYLLGMSGVFFPHEKENWITPAELGILLSLIGLLCKLRLRSIV